MEVALIVVVVLLAIVLAGVLYQRSAERKKAERELEETRDALAAARKEQEQAVADRDEARQARVQADTELGEARREAEGARAKVTDLEQRVVEAKKAVEDRDELDRTSREQTEQVAALEEELARARTMLHTAADELSVARQRATEAEEELTTADRRVAEVEKDVHDELASLRSQLADARDDLAVARAEAGKERTAENSVAAGVGAAAAGGVALGAASRSVQDGDGVAARAAGEAGGATQPASFATALQMPTGTEAQNLWDLELLRLQRHAASIDQRHVDFDDEPGPALVQALRIEASSMRDLVGTGGGVHAESLPPVSTATALVALRISQEVLGAIGRQCDRVDVVVSDEDGLTITIAGQQPDDPVDPYGVLDRLGADRGSRGGVTLVTAAEDEVFLTVANFAGVDRAQAGGDAH